ncbi:PREDICTED: CKLF-like MARVEL transmembrane domain-containing protein 1 [Propithecus coquereli]|uniref:CKLF-like MARVEL transmembrane domain-containing protein 1 n=1 Tax=Propithecus coquereli TaxID=379532 RepID=UPI00063F2AC4|nr:PREDICTED: CKLF-like MARVEL transmembrane domain-containing protein 1 [Propithecus coquereli]
MDDKGSWKAHLVRGAATRVRARRVGGQQPLGRKAVSQERTSCCRGTAPDLQGQPDTARPWGPTMEPKDTKREFAKTLPANLQPEPPTPPAPSTISVSDAPPPQAKGSVRAVRVALPKKSVQSRRPKPSAQSLSKSSKEGMIKKRAKEGTIKKPAEELTKKQAEEEIKKYAEEEEVKKRAEGRAKVPQKFRDSLKRFFFSPTGMLKILRMGFIIGALACFIIVEANESYIAITVLEISIVLFFILIYMLTLHHLLTYLHWPLLSAK